MSGIVHLSEAANLGLHAMIVLAGEPKALIRTAEMAELLSVSGDHLAKVLQGLVRAGLLESTRGPRGGFQLSRPASDISLLEIYQAIEGELRPSACLLGQPRCSGECVLGDFILSVNEDFRKRFAHTRLSDVAGAIRRRPSGMVPRQEPRQPGRR